MCESEEAKGVEARRRRPSHLSLAPAPPPLRCRLQSRPSILHVGFKGKSLLPEGKEEIRRARSGKQ